MKRVLRTACMVLALLVCLGNLAVPARADSSLDAKVPVTIVMQGEVLPASDEFTATLTPLDGAPAPVQSSLTIKALSANPGQKTTAYFDLRGLALGDYWYDLDVSASKYYLAADDNAPVKFLVHVQVTNKVDSKGNIDYSGIMYRIISRKYDGDTAPDRDSKDKVDNEVVCKYIKPMTIEVVKKWIDQDSHRPSQVNVYLATGNTVADIDKNQATVLNKYNEWQDSFTGLDPRKGYKVREYPVPAGYTASYKYEVDKDDPSVTICYITNTGSLLQTGQLNWPIPVLCAAGSAMLVLGMLMMGRRKREDAE